MDGIYNLRDESFANYTTDLEKDLDLRGNLMKKFESEKENINAVKAQITLVRFALNVIAIYTDCYGCSRMDRRCRCTNCTYIDYDGMGNG